MSKSLRKLFDENKLHSKENGTINVLVSLNSVPSDSCLNSLKTLGLSVSSVTKNLLTGEISSEFLEKLQAHDSVVEVEQSVPLKTKKESLQD